MKKKAETRKIVKLEKKSGSFIKIYDLYIQRTEGFHVKFFEDKYIYVKQVRLFDIIKVKNLYPRFIFYQKYPNSEQTISPIPYHFENYQFENYHFEKNSTISKINQFENYHFENFHFEKLPFRIYFILNKLKTKFL